MIGITTRLLQWLTEGVPGVLPCKPSEFREATEPPQSCDVAIPVVVLCGSAALPTILSAVQHASSDSFGATMKLPILVTGGIGHSTSFLLEALLLQTFAELRRHTFAQPAHLCATDLWRLKATNELMAVVLGGMMKAGQVPEERVRDGLAACEVEQEGYDESGLVKLCLSLGLSEAEWIGAILQFWFLTPREWIWLETNSTNCGANAQNSVALLATKAHDSVVGNITYRLLVFQDPTMQRRTLLSFCKAFESAETPSYLSFELLTPAPHPVVQMIQDNLKQEVVDEIPLLQGAVLSSCGYQLERLVSLVVGEWERLRNDADGYGPQGKGFIAPCDIPTEIDEAFHDLAEAFSIESRPA